MFENFNAPLKIIKHSNLERANNSLVHSKCPTCKDGILLVKRSEKDSQILPIDRCIKCGQSVYYKDIEKLQKNLKVTASK